MPGSDRAMERVTPPCHAEVRLAFRFPEAGLQFLRDLAENNDKTWFEANRDRYEAEVATPARALVGEVNAVLRDIAPSHVTEPSKALSRIHRDVMFSKDKAPYNTRLWAAFTRADVPRDRSAAFYVGLAPEGCDVGAGVWMPPKDRMDALRTHIAENHERLRAIVEAPPFAATYGPLKGEASKRVPEPWPADHPAAPWLVLQGGHVRYPLAPSVVTSPDLVAVIAAHFGQLAPLVAFMDEALAR
jgi:uncharacterized protein (TIGR02453 family)